MSTIWVACPFMKQDHKQTHSTHLLWNIYSTSVGDAMITAICTWVTGSLRFVQTGQGRMWARQNPSLPCWPWHRAPPASLRHRAPVIVTTWTAQVVSWTVLCTFSWHDSDPISENRQQCEWWMRSICGGPSRTRWCGPQVYVTLVTTNISRKRAGPPLPGRDVNA